jgi:hypothetical protein
MACAPFKLAGVLLLLLLLLLVLLHDNSPEHNVRLNTPA